MANQYSKLTADNIVRKLNRKSNPVTSLAQLAREFGVSTAFTRRHNDYYGRVPGQIDHSVPSSFREKVRSLMGTTDLNAIRRRKHINHGFEGYIRSW